MNLKYIFLRQGSFFLKALQEIIIRIFISPEKLAVFNLIIIVQGTFSMFQSSLEAASLRMITQLTGNESLKNIIRFKTIILMFFQQLFLSVMIFIFAPLIWNLENEYQYYTLIASSTLVFFTGFLNLGINFHESDKKFDELGISLMIISSFSFIIVVYSAIEFGLKGIIIGTVLSIFISCIVVLFSLKSSSISFYGLKIKKNLSYKNLGVSALNIKAADLPITFFYQIDVILASLLLTSTDLAIYITAKFIITFMSHITVSTSRLNIVSLGNKLGRNIPLNDLKKFLLINFNYIYLIVIPITVIFFEPSCKFIISKFLPEYDLSNQLIHILMFQLLYAPGSLFLRNYWIQTGKYRTLFIHGFFSIAIMTVAFYLLWNSLEKNLLSFCLCIVYSQLPIVFLTISMIAFSFKSLKVFSIFSLISCISLFYFYIYGINLVHENFDDYSNIVLTLKLLIESIIIYLPFIIASLIINIFLSKYLYAAKI